MRLRNDAQAQEKLLNSNYLVNSLPLIVNEKYVIELGMGKGEMLTQMAHLNPHLIFVGIEKNATVAAKAAARATALQLNNFFIINHDINNLEDLIKGQVDTLWLTFSDPWPKKRHFKRRLTYKSFLQSYQNILTKKGILKLKTDNLDFFNFSLESLITNQWKIIFTTNDLHQSVLANCNIMTGYEQKWSQKGVKINYLEAKY